MSSETHSSANDEIDLIELAQALWRQKVLIVISVIASTLVALGYSFSVTPIFSSTAVIAPANINSFGTLAGALAERGVNKQEYSFESGIRLANETLGLLITNLDSQILRRSFDEENPELRQVAFKASRGRAATDPVSLNATSTEPEATKIFIDRYLAFVAAATVTQLNEYLKGMGVSEEVHSSAVYRLEQPSFIPSTPTKPKRALITALGFVLGGMVGVFIALVRHMLINRANNNAG